MVEMKALTLHVQWIVFGEINHADNTAESSEHSSIQQFPLRSEKNEQGKLRNFNKTYKGEFLPI
jgi:hypothetical protein